MNEREEGPVLEIYLKFPRLKVPGKKVPAITTGPLKTRLRLETMSQVRKVNSDYNVNTLAVTSQLLRAEVAELTASSLRLTD